MGRLMVLLIKPPIKSNTSNGCASFYGEDFPESNNGDPLEVLDGIAESTVSPGTPGIDRFEEWVELRHPDERLSPVHRDHINDDMEVIEPPEACQKCGGLELWESVASDLFRRIPSRWRCVRCDPPRQLRRPNRMPQRHADICQVDWPVALTDFVLLLGADDLPPTFSLGPGRVVVDSAKYLRWLQADIRRGPTGPRARYGVLQSDLERLREMLNVPVNHDLPHSCRPTDTGAPKR